MMKHIKYAIVILVILVVLIVTVPLSFGASSIVHDNAANSATINGPSSISMAITISADATLATACIFHDNPSVISSVTIGGDAASFVVSSTAGNGGYRMDMYQLLAPSSGSVNATTTFGGAAFGTMSVSTYEGTATSDPIDDTNTNSAVGGATSLDLHATSTVVDAWSVGCWEVNTSGALTPSASTTERVEFNDATFGYSTVVSDSNVGISPAGGYTLSESWSGSKPTGGTVAVVKQPAAAAMPKRRYPIFIESVLKTTNFIAGLFTQNHVQAQGVPTRQLLRSGLTKDGGFMTTVYDSATNEIYGYHNDLKGSENMKTYTRSHDFDKEYVIQSASLLGGEIGTDTERVVIMKNIIMLLNKILVLQRQIVERLQK